MILRRQKKKKNVGFIGFVLDFFKFVDTRLNSNNCSTNMSRIKTKKFEIFDFLSIEIY